MKVFARNFLAAIASITVVLLTGPRAQGAFQKIEGLESDLRIVYVSRFDDNLIYVTSAQTLFRSNNGGTSWQKLLVTKDGEIKDIALDYYLFNKLYVATSRQLFRLVDDKVEKIFTQIDDGEITSVAVGTGEIYLGTTSGAYVSKEDFIRWRKIQTIPEDVHVYVIKLSQAGQEHAPAYVASSRGVYVTRDFNDFTRTFFMRDYEDGENYIIPHDILVDTSDPQKVYLATSKGLFVSPDYGYHWQKKFTNGTGILTIHGLAQSPHEDNVLYCAAEQGIFRIDLATGKMNQLFEGLESSSAEGIDFNKEGVLFTATKRGLFRNDYFMRDYFLRGTADLLEGEPSIHVVQQLALRYNAVHPDKIEKWRRGLRYRALFPSINLGYDKTIYGTAGGASYEGKSFVGPRDWNLSFSWDVANLIWNTYEDDVDTRARLNTQLRLDILDEVNRVYFERLRLKQELKELPHPERLQKELRLRELTAILDSYTGGRFSRLLAQGEEN